MELIDRSDRYYEVVSEPNLTKPIKSQVNKNVILEKLNRPIVLMQYI